MDFNLNQCLEMLSRTPAMFRNHLDDLSDNWLDEREKEGAFSARDILGHLVFGEQTDWVPRIKIILKSGTEKPFEPYDRFAQDRLFENSTIQDLWDLFESMRNENLDYIRSLNLSETQLNLKGIHPDPKIGKVTLKQLMATWVVHDLSHINQMTRTWVKSMDGEMKQWGIYMNRVLKS